MAIYISSGIVEDRGFVQGDNLMIVLSGGTAKDTIVTDYGSMIISEGGIANSTTVNNYGSMIVSNGGTATETTIEGGSMEVASGGMAYDIVVDARYANSTVSGNLYVNGTATRIIVCSNGRMVISSGGMATETTVMTGGNVMVSSGGTATITFNPWQGQVVSSAGATVTYLERDANVYWGNYSSGIIGKADIANNTSLYYTMFIYSDGIAANTAVYAGDMHISSGGTADNTTVYAGNMHISSGGTARETFVCSGGRLNGFSLQEDTYFSSIINGAVNISNAIVSEEARIYSGCIASSTNVKNYGNMIVSNGGIAIDSLISYLGKVIVSNGGCANSTLIGSSASMIVSEGGSANETTIDFAGNMIILKGGIASNTFVDQGSLTVSCGGRVEGTILDYGRLTISNGGIANSTTINSLYGAYVLDGGVANNTTVNYGGYIDIGSGGTATIAFNPWQGNIVSATGAAVTYLERDANVYYGAYGSGLISKADIMSGTIISSGVSMFVYSGGTANNTIVNSGGCVHIHSGGMATETSVSSGGQINGFSLQENTYFSSIINGAVNVSNAIVSGEAYLYDNGTADNTTVSFRMFISSGGVANNTTVKAGGSMVVSCGGVASSAIITGNDYWSAGYIFVNSGGLVSKALIGSHGYMHVSGGIAYDTIVDSEGHISVFSGGLVNNVTINPGGYMDVFAGGTASGTVVNYFVGLNVSSGGTAVQNTISSGGSLRVFNGGTANNTTVNSAGSMLLDGGGTATGTTVCSGGQLNGFTLQEDTYFSSIINGAINISNAIVSGAFAQIVDGAVATNTSVTSGSLSVWNGGIANNTILADSGRMYLEEGGIANDTTVNGNYYYGGMYIFSGGTANRTNVNNGSMYISNGGLANSTVINGGRVFVSEGGAANNTLLNGGSMGIVSGGMAKNTVINSGGVYVSHGGMATETSVGVGGFLYVSSGGTAAITFNPWQGQVVSSAGATVTYLERDANVYWGNGALGIVGKTDIAEKFIISSGVSMFVYSGGTATDTTVNAYGSMIVSSGGTATIAFNPWQGQVVSSVGAKVTYLERDANVYWGNYSAGMIGKADVVENTVISSGFNMLVYSGGSTNHITVQWGGVIVASSGGTVNNTTVNFGSMFVYDGGAAINTSVIQEGRANIFSGGIAANTTVHGYLFIDEGGTANCATVGSAAAMDVFGVANDVIVTSGGQMNIRLGGSASGIVAANGAQLGINVYRDTYIQGTSNGSAFEMKNALLSGYTANGGYVEIGYGGSATDTTLSDCSLYVESGGYAKDTTMNAGSMSVERGGIACNTTITSAARIQVSGGKLSGELNITGGAKVNVSNGGVVDFTVTGRSASDGYLVNDLSDIGGAPTFTITVTNTQEAGNYKLAQNAFSVSRFITIGNGSFDYGVLTCNGGSIKYGDNEYSLLLHETGNLTLEVKKIGVAPDTEAPTITQIAANTTAPTNQNVTVSAVFADNVALTSQQYRLGSGNWLDYAGAITVTANTTVYFKAVDTAGNEANAQYVVSNIDKVAPTITQVKANTMAPTNQDVAVTAVFADNVALKSQQYKIGNGGWTNYTGAVTMTTNGTVYFKAVDTAGNEANEQYVVSNIDKVAPTITQVKANTTAPTNQNVAVTANFTDDVALKSQQYKIGNGSWQNYTGAVTMTTNGTVYFRAVDTAGNEVSAQYAVSNIDKTAPSITGIVANTTAPTAQDVTVTANFADNVALKSQQYKIGDGSWQNYTNGVTMTANSTVYFKAVDTAGNEATGQYTVANIDKIAPDAPILSVTPLNRTNGTVTVTANFASDVVKKEYSLDGQNWQAYTKAVEVTANTTIQVRGYDEAGNVSGAEYEIANIVPLDAKGPGAVILVPKVSKYNVTVKWTRPATQNKAKITGYEVEYNGKISIVKGTSLSLKNVAVSTGNTVQVRAIDSLGRYGALSSVATFDVKDVTAPTLGKITAAIDDYAGTIAWSGSDNVGIVKYVVTCAGQSQTVTSGTSAKFDNFAIGKYKATVQAFDAAGNASKVGSVSITVKDVTPPEKVTGLAIPLADAKYNALLSWAPGVDNSGKVSGYEIKLDNGKILRSSKNSLKVSKLSVGTHTYQVRAIDKDKNIGSWSDVQTFTVRDMTAPASVKAKAAVDGYSVSFVLSGKDNSGRIAKYVVTCGDKSVTTTSATAVLHDFGVGKQTALVVAYDAEGNASKTAKVSFTVKDATPPEKVTGLAIPLEDAKYNALLSWAPGVDNSGKVSGYEIKLDNGKILKSSKNSLKVSKLSVGTHTYQVRAIDRDKNIGSWSEVQTFTVRDMTAPAPVSAKAKVEGNSLSLNWKTPKDNVGVTGYILKHGVNLEKIETLTASQLSFQIDGIAKGGYQYQIVAVDAAGNQSKVKSGKATIKTELPMAAMSLELPDAIPSLDFDAGVSSENANAGLRYDDLLAFCSVLQTENELRLAVSDLFASDKENKSLALLAVGF